MAGEEKFVMLVDVDGSCIEDGRAAGVTELANGEERSVSKGGKKVGNAGGSRKTGKIKVNLVG